MNSDVILNKCEVIERCLKRVTYEYKNDPKNLQDYTVQDSIILNIQRMCEACIDLAMHIVSEKKLGIPQNSKDGFEMLFKEGIIDNDLNKKLKAMIGFRNIAVHDYQNINIEILKNIIEKHLSDIEKFKSIALSLI